MKANSLSAALEAGNFHPVPKQQQRTGLGAWLFASGGEDQDLTTHTP